MKSIFVSNLLAGKVAFVTGGGSGIGAGIAKRLAEQGARVGLLGRRAEKLEDVAKQIRDAGGEASCHAADVRNYAQLEAAIRACADKFGRLDVLVNSAAGNELRQLLNPTGVPEFEAVARTGVGVFDTLKATAKLVLTELRKGGA